MKRLITIIIVAIIISSTVAMASSINWDFHVYENQKVAFTVKPFIKNGDHLLLRFNWQNKTSRSESFVWLISAKAYQNGMELRRGILFNPESNTTRDILPGYTATSYCYFSLEDESDITIIINDILYPGDTEKGIVLTFPINDVEPYNE